ncbi:MAG TPA: hypothetical protein VM925_21655 [Labilithrix sp.]|nr:hypothetical protein [Labilithrix sp.]
MTDEHDESPTILDLHHRIRELERAVAALELRVGHGPAPAVTPTSPAALPAAEDRPDLETHVATYWVGRIGIVALITGLAFFVTFHFGDLGAIARVLLGYLAAAVLSGTGVWLTRRYAMLGQLLFGGGLAVGYFVTYALHFVPAVRVVDSEVMGIVLLAVIVVGIVAGAQRFRSETVGGVGLFLGLHTSFVSEATLFTLVATLLLAGGAVFFLVKNRWVIVPLTTVIAVYSSHLAGCLVGPAKPGSDGGIGLVFLLLYFIVFGVAALARPTGLSLRTTLALTLSNIIGAVTLGAYEAARLEESRLAGFFGFMTLLLAGAAAYAATKRARSLLQVHAGAAVVTAAALALELFDGSARVFVWTALGTTAIVAGSRLESVAWRALGLIVLGGTVVTSFFVDFQPLLLVPLAAAFVAASRREPVDLLVVFAVSGAVVATARALTFALPPSLTTLAWSLAAFGLIGVGIALRVRALRIGSLVLGAAALGRLVLDDLGRLSADMRILTLVIIGAAMLGVSFAYTRFQDRLSRWL